MSGSAQCNSDETQPLQFSLRGAFAFVTAIAAVVGLAVSQLAGWTMVVVGFVLGALNCAGRLQFLQKPAAQPRLFCLGWALLALSLYMPAVKGCGDESVPGWRAAVACGQLAVDLSVRDRWGIALLYDWLLLGNLLLFASPLFLWRLRRGGGTVYSVLLAMTVAAMCCLSIHGTNQCLAGYYIWCLAGLTLLCTARMRWPTLVLMALVVSLILTLNA